jgi:hypothetical protein
MSNDQPGVSAFMRALARLRPLRSSITGRKSLAAAMAIVAASPSSREGEVDVSS